MSQSRTSATAATSSLLQVHHNFRWILLSTQAEPVSGFLQRHLRRRLIGCAGSRDARCSPETTGMNGDDDVGDSHSDNRMGRVVEWLPRAWQQINRFLEARCTTADVTIGNHFILFCIGN